MSPCRTTSWSSRRYTRIGAALGHGSIPTSIGCASADGLGPGGAGRFRDRLRAPSRRVLYAPGGASSARLVRPWHASRRVLYAQAWQVGATCRATRVAVVDNAGKTRPRAFLPGRRADSRFRSGKTRRVGLPGGQRPRSSTRSTRSRPASRVGDPHDGAVPWPRRRGGVSTSAAARRRSYRRGGRPARPAPARAGRRARERAAIRRARRRDLCVPVAQPAVEAVGQRVQPAAELAWRSAPSTSSSVADGWRAAYVLRQRAGEDVRVVVDEADGATGRRPGRARRQPVAPQARGAAHRVHAKRISSAA